MCKIFSDDIDKLLMKKNHMRYVMSLDRHLEKRRSYLHTSSDKKFSTMSLIDMTQFKITKERIVFFHLCHIQFFSSLTLFGKICPLLLLSESRHKIPFKFMLRYFWHDDKWQLVAIFFLFIYTYVEEFMCCFSPTFIIISMKNSKNKYDKVFFLFGDLHHDAWKFMHLTMKLYTCYNNHLY